jgi:hypothetical protein
MIGKKEGELSKAITMLDVNVIFGHHSEAVETTSR